MDLENGLNQSEEIDESEPRVKDKPKETNYSEVMKNKDDQPRVKPRGKLRCVFPNCTVINKKLECLQAHIRKDHEGDSTPYHCTQCPLKFKNNVKLVTHLRTHGASVSKPLQRQLCVEVCVTKSSLISHLENNHMALKLKPKCSTCGKTFDDDEQVQTHEDLHALRLNAVPFSCVLCSINFVSSIELREHVLNEHEEGLSKCSECNKSFLTSERLKKHREMCHPAVTMSHLSYSCPQCPYQASFPSALKQHLLKHDEKLIFTCDWEGCGKVFKYPQTLSHHRKLDHGEKQDQDPKAYFKYRCSLCPNAFTSSKYLRKHQASHFETRAFKCEHCSQKFKSSEDLRTHKKVHETETDDKLKGTQRPVIPLPGNAKS